MSMLRYFGFVFSDEDNRQVADVGTVFEQV
jgi:hypothetical protein